MILAAKKVVAGYYDGWMRSDDELYPCDTRTLSLRAAPNAPAGTAPPDNKCGGRMARVVSEQGLYTQLAFFRRLLGASPLALRLRSRLRSVRNKADAAGAPAQ